MRPKLLKRLTVVLLVCSACTVPPKTHQPDNQGSDSRLDVEVLVSSVTCSCINVFVDVSRYMLELLAV